MSKVESNAIKAVKMNIDKEQLQHIQNMRAKQAASYLSCGVSTIWLWAKQGKITPIKLSERVTIFKKEDLDNFIAGGTK